MMFRCYVPESLALFALIPLAILVPSQGAVAQGLPNANQIIRGKHKDSMIVIKTTSRLAGAIDSLRWNGQEFINSTDHGRQLQSASNFDAGSRFTPETFNPTEAGSRSDGAGATSSSRLLHLVANNNQLQSTTQMAFWLRPGEKSAGNPAKNKGPLSNHLLTKRVTIGFQNLTNVIEYDVTFSLPMGEQHTYAQFEAVTGYMPPVFEQFYSFHPDSGRLTSLSDGPGEQPHPVVLATNSGSHAMGIYSPDQPSDGFENAGYGRFRFVQQRVVKWNCVFRVKSPAPIAAKDYRFRSFVIIGTLDDVQKTMAQLNHLRNKKRM